MDDQASTSLTAYRIFQLVANLVLIAIILVGNIITIIVQFLSNRRFGGLPNQLVFNLAIADLLTGLAILYGPITALNRSLVHSYSNKIVCLLPDIFLYSGSIANFFSITAIAAERYSSIIHPVFHRKYVTKRIVSASIAISWCITALISTGPIFWINSDTKRDCFYYVTQVASYDHTVFVPIFFTIWFVLHMLYWRIWRAAKSHTQRMRARSKVVDQNVRKKNGNSHMTIVVILGCFSICWLPFMVISVLEKLNLCNNNKVIYVAFWIALSNSGINPIIYAWRNPAFRKAYNHLLRRKAPNNNCNESNGKNLKKNSDSKKDNTENENHSDAVTLETISVVVDSTVSARGL